VLGTTMMMMTTTQTMMIPEDRVTCLPAERSLAWQFKIQPWVGRHLMQRERSRVF
jgi:hypothetical protein